MLSSVPMLGGVRLAPLPASVLPSTLTVSEPVADSEYGDEWSEPYEVAHVRLMAAGEYRAATGAAPSGYAIREDSSGVVLIDASSSDGAREVAVGSSVSVDGGEPMEVVRVTPCLHMDGSVHHWEVEVR